MLDVAGLCVAAAGEDYVTAVIASLAGGVVREFHQPHLRGGIREKLTRGELAATFHADLGHGGWSRPRAERLERLCDNVFDQSRIDLSQI